MVLPLIVLSLNVGLAQPQADDSRFRPPQTMRCLWFTNFENSRFGGCRVRGRSIIKDGAVPVFGKGGAAAFDREARKLLGTPTGDAPWGEFEVTIVGRPSLIRREHSRYLGDRPWDVKVDRLISMRLVRGRD